MSVTWKFAWIAKKLILIGSFNIQGLKLLAWIHFTFKLPLMKGSEITTLLWPPVDFGKKINSFRSRHRKLFYKMELHSSKICKIAGFQPLVTAAMWTILEMQQGSWIHPWNVNIEKAMATLISMLFLFTKFILIFELKY